ncbi:MAG TPA: GNAT family N-acetyltransferase, partial [Paracoccaceae bacterium]|nr:GNAT family N-acetyltransferase [Paracoccaceae bacterium]
VEDLYALTEATWPPATKVRIGPWDIREGRGAGSRVSAATPAAPATALDLPLAEQEMRNLGQTPLFMIRRGEDWLDEMLAAQGYAIKDPVSLRLAPVGRLAALPLERAKTFRVWPPLETQKEIWAGGGIGPARLAVMDRADGPKTTILGRDGNSPAGTVFVAMQDNLAMLHAMEVAAAFRRRGLARKMIAAVGHWAADHGASHVALLVTKANAGANALYASMGFEVVGEYHYRIKTE